VALLAGVGLSIALFLHVPQRVTTMERLVGHATATFEGVEARISGFFIVMGVVALVAGLVVWAGLLLLARRSEPDGRRSA
jgi:predicted PurR-regulated permease PerM